MRRINATDDVDDDDESRADSRAARGGCGPKIREINKLADKADSIYHSPTEDCSSIPTSISISMFNFNFYFPFARLDFSIVLSRLKSAHRKPKYDWHFGNFLQTDGQLKSHGEKRF